MANFDDKMFSAFMNEPHAAVAPPSDKIMKEFIINKINCLEISIRRDIGIVITRAGYTFDKCAEGSIINLKSVRHDIIERIYAFMLIKLETPKK